MGEFWEESFQGKKLMWGEGPARSALVASDYFKKEGVERVLIPGIGYGRNATPFLDLGMSVVGIEISQTAIDLAHGEMGLDIPIYHGSVCDMPFDAEIYDGIFCHAVIHLLDEDCRAKLIADSLAQLRPGGVMIFTMVSTDAPSFGKGERIGHNRYAQHGGAEIFFYDEAAVRDEFGEAGLEEVRDISEPGNGSAMPLLMAICRKN